MIQKTTERKETETIWYVFGKFLQLTLMQDKNILGCKTQQSQVKNENTRNFAQSQSVEERKHNIGRESKDFDKRAGIPKRTVFGSCRQCQ